MAKQISRAEALQISKETLERAERERIEYAEREAKISVDLDEQHELIALKLKINYLKEYAEKLANAKLMDWFRGIGTVDTHWTVKVVQTVGKRILKELEDLKKDKT